MFSVFFFSYSSRYLKWSKSCSLLNGDVSKLNAKINFVNIKQKNHTVLILIFSLLTTEKTNGHEDHILIFCVPSETQRAELQDVK